MQIHGINEYGSMARIRPWFCSFPQTWITLVSWIFKPQEHAGNGAITINSQLSTTTATSMSTMLSAILTSLMLLQLIKMLKKFRWWNRTVLRSCNRCCFLPGYQEAQVSDTSFLPKEVCVQRLLGKLSPSLNFHKFISRKTHCKNQQQMPAMALFWWV